jgi:hypothetical protein
VTYIRNVTCIDSGTVESSVMNKGRFGWVMASSSLWKKLRICTRHDCRTRLLVNRVIFWESGLRPTIFGRSRLTFQHETIRRLTRLVRTVVIHQPLCVAQAIGEEADTLDISMAPRMVSSPIPGQNPSTSLD